MERKYHKWTSKALGRDMELLVFGHAGAKVIVFPTRGGRFYEFENMKITDVLAPKIKSGQLQLYCVDAIDGESYYCWWAHPSGRINRQVEYEQYILEEVFPFMERKNKNPCTVSHGCSLGAFQAANIAFRHPERFQKLVAFSGRYDLTTSIEHFRSLFDDYYDETIYYNTPTHYLPKMEDASILTRLRQMEMIFTIGDADPFRANNEQLSTILREKQIPHQMHRWHGRAHSAYYWRQMAALYL